MKTIIAWLILSAPLTSISKGQNESSPDPYPIIDKQASIGRDSTLKSVIIESDAIYVGSILKLGPEMILAHGEVIRLANRIIISQTLKGPVSASISIEFKVRSYLKEKEPVIGSSYLFFAKQNVKGASDPFILLKLLPATGANIAKVKALIAAAPAPK